MEHVESVLARVELDDPFDYALGDLREAQLEAANERLEVALESVPLLRRRAADMGVKQINRLQDIVPLLFSHTTYKSYPEALVRNGRWPTLARWLDTLSTRRGSTEVDFDGVATIDDWVDRLHGAGHLVSATSGTTGKCSLFNSSEVETEVGNRQRSRLLTWSTGLTPAQRLPTFVLLPRRSTYRTVRSFHDVVSEFGEEGHVYWMTDEPMLMADVSRMAELRQAIADGSARPSDVAAFEAESQARAARIAADFEKLVDALMEHRSQPLLLMGLVPQHWDLVEALRSRGVTSDALHPDSVVWPGGGPKGRDLPADYLDQMRAVYGVPDARWYRTYGMTEIVNSTVACPQGNYHLCPWHIALVLDRTGENLVEPVGGTIEGRMAFFDISISARWGGIISGDQVTLDLTPCECGRTSPSVRSVSRYVENEDEKLTCSGTLDAYVRGMIGDDS